MPIQTFVVEDNERFSRALLQLLAEAGGFTILSVAASIAAALAFDGNIAAELVLLDIHLPDGNGLSLIAPLLMHWPACKIVVLTMEDSPQMRQRALNAGARAFVGKDEATETLLPTIDALLKQAAT